MLVKSRLDPVYCNTVSLVGSVIMGVELMSRPYKHLLSWDLVGYSNLGLSICFIGWHALLSSQGTIIFNNAEHLLKSCNVAMLYSVNQFSLMG